MVKLWNALRQDVSAFRHRLTGCQPPDPGLYTYRFALRVETCGCICASKTILAGCCSSM